MIDPQARALRFDDPIDLLHRGFRLFGIDARRIARAVAVLRAEFARPLPVEHLAAAAGMSPSSFHQHFRAVTSLTPLQFQKQLRLIEARRLMLSEGVTASSAAFAVGYESVPQFTREYNPDVRLAAGAGDESGEAQGPGGCLARRRATGPPPVGAWC